MRMSRTINVTIIHHGYRNPDGTLRRRWVEVRQMTVDDGLRAIVAPVDFGNIPHQRSGTTCKRRCPPPRSTNKIVHVGQYG